ncbi:MAG: hypothetical protein ACLTDR_03175 [Adlercreutzia equolifaciens]
MLGVSRNSVTSVVSRLQAQGSAGEAAQCHSHHRCATLLAEIARLEQGSGLWAGNLPHCFSPPSSLTATTISS